MKKISLKIEENILIALSLIMFWGALVYYFYNLSWSGIAIILILSGWSFYLRAKLGKEKIANIDAPEKEAVVKKNQSRLKWLIIIYFAIIAACFSLLAAYASAAALISPWLKVPYYFFAFYAISTALLLYIIAQPIKDNSKLWLIRLHYFLAFGVAIIVYKIGYGFDPFIHQATMELIDKQGYVLPKPLYYLGQYSLIIILHKFTGLSIYFLNKILVPLAAALFIPGALAAFLKTKNKNSGSAITILALLALPFNLFILSTPQNLTYVWLILLIFYSLADHLRGLPLILSLATLAIHPLTGIPALCFVIWKKISEQKKQLKSSKRKLINILMWLVTALSLPLSFTIVTGQSWQDISLSWNSLLSIFNFKIINTNVSNVILNLLALLSNCWLIIFIILALSGLFIWFKNNRHEASLIIKIASALLVGFLLSASLSFNFLIDYERNDYIFRLPILIGLFVLPAIVIVLNKLVTKFLNGSKMGLIGSWLFVTILITASLYLSYPRLDDYENAHGYSVSKTDILAVRSIAAQTNKPYIVLANQQTSVASLKELGFNHYLKVGSQQIFFYPIPTGGQLYQYYLEMVNKNPDRATMVKAMDLTGVKESYLVVSKYWQASSRIIAEAKLSANSYWEINNGDIYIFKFIY